MKYYEINMSDDLKIIGHYPQTFLGKNYNPTLPNSHRQVRTDQFPDFEPNFELDMNKKAISTNYLYSSDLIGMTIDHSFKVILETFILPPHRFYPIKVYHKKELLEYYWFHFIVDDFWTWLDKDQSVAVIYDQKEKRDIEKRLDLNLSREEIVDLKYNKLPYYQETRWKKIAFKREFPKYDVYNTQGFGFTIVISERLLNALKKEGMTGFQVKPFDKIAIE